jgi:hypothetical protein
MRPLEVETSWVKGSVERDGVLHRATKGIQVGVVLF